MSAARVALVTGASRGIGRGCALALARAGFDVALCARTVKEGEGRTGSIALPGSLEKVAAEISGLGRRALPVPMDLTRAASIALGVERALEELGRIDVLVSSAIHTGGNAMALFVDTPMSDLRAAFECNVLGPLELIQRVVRAMLAQGGGLVIHVSSGAGQNESAKLPGQGGWGLGYSLTKAASNRMAAGLGKELRRHGIAVVNLEPGVVATEKMLAVTSKQGIDAAGGVSVDVAGAVCAYIATHPTPMIFSGRSVDAPQFSGWARLVDATHYPFPYGPSAWGLPPAIAIAGAATGVASEVPSPPADAGGRKT
jgi:NAD(P)-dependent dehydrogenase (short-subunit alcohol dehydrogenase family)